MLGLKQKTKSPIVITNFLTYTQNTKEARMNRQLDMNLENATQYISVLLQ